jgi:peptidyl-tRNA hydrolase, PTH1 family
LSSEPEHPETAEQHDRCMIVGLGNPGTEYDGTRHNVGFAVLDRLSESLDIPLERLKREKGLSGRVKARIAKVPLAAVERPPVEGQEGGQTSESYCLLVKPMTYMNLSGVAIAAIARHHEIPAESIFVIYDDLNLPLGRMRIRSGGSPAGHNGIKSLIACLGTEGFPRLRMGIGAEGMLTSEMVDPDFVLSKFDPAEVVLLERVCEKTVEAALAWLRSRDTETLMGRYNGFRASESGEETP